MNKLEAYEKVNRTTTLKELADVIREFGDKIPGKSKDWNTERMAEHCENYNLDIHNCLTRNFGIRQQAMMILFYNNPFLQ